MRKLKDDADSQSLHVASQQVDEQHGPERVQQRRQQDRKEDE